MTNVARHLKIDLADYDRRIRTFIPGYDEMLSAVASTVTLVDRRQPVIVDLGIGTGALAARCLATRPGAQIHGIDADPDILEMARRRLARRRPSRLTLAHADFVRAPLPRCDAIVATLALHHVRSAPAKRRFYARCFAALRRGGVFASGDCFVAEDPVLTRRYLATWKEHLRTSYGPRETRKYFAAWAREDTYFPLAREWTMLAAAGFRVEVLWRRPPFAVLLGRKAAA
jgi:SAM-dependent methyltransferase